ncbi:MAG TPA: hypothetical protein VEG64_16900 [Candidatus Sulfotelmatobacter sp.]|nr:hypothetical protein [Candidatus Sulfotelmatobacter sp.]
MKRTPTAKLPGTTPAARGYSDDPRYTRGAWPKLSRVMRGHNPVCQKILNVGMYKNEQCHNASTLVHHLVSPKERPDLFLVPSNLVCLCENCHPPTEGTPDWVAGKDYVATVLPKWRVS